MESACESIDGYPQKTDLKFNIVENWQFRFAAECVAEVTSRTLTAEAPSYATILELDRKVREFPLPDGISNSDDFGASFTRCVLEHVKETGSLFNLRCARRVS